MAEREKPLFLIRRFSPGKRYEPGKMTEIYGHNPLDSGGFVLLHEKNEIIPDFTTDYLVEVIRYYSKAMIYVKIITSTKEIFEELSESLCTEKWERNGGALSETVACFKHEKYGDVVASYYEFSGTRLMKHQLLEISFRLEESDIAFKLDNGSVNMRRVVRAIHAQVGSICDSNNLVGCGQPNRRRL